MTVDKKNGLQICLATKYDGQAFIDLFNSTYLRKIDVQYYEWQFFNQTIDSSLIIARVDGKLVGTHGHHFYKGHMPDREIPLLCGIDTMVDKDYQGRGIYRAMVDSFMQLAIRTKTPVVFVMANKNTFLALTERMQWKLIAEIEDMACKTNIKAKPLRNIQIEEIRLFDDQAENIHNRFMKSHPDLLVVGRETAHMNWRFVHHPVYQYEIFLIKSNLQIFGYLILKVFRDPLTNERIGDIVDLFWGEDDAETLDEILRFALVHFHSKGIKKVVTWLKTNTIVDEIGRKMGFAETGQKRYLCCRVLDPTYNWLGDARHWFITMADAEIY
jgi:hypothetical protein